MLTKLMVEIACQLEIIGLTCIIILGSVTCMVFGCLTIILRSIIGLIMIVETIRREHSLSLPALNWFKYKRACKSSSFSFILSLVFLDNTQWIIIIVYGKILAVTTISIIDWLRRITDNSLTI